jgi:hypothetical protein
MKAVSRLLDLFQIHVKDVHIRLEAPVTLQLQASKGSATAPSADAVPSSTLTARPSTATGTGASRSRLTPVSFSLGIVLSGLDIASPDVGKATASSTLSFVRKTVHLKQLGMWVKPLCTICFLGLAE